MSRSDTPILCLIRYGTVGRLQLTHFFCPDTTPRAGCLCDFPICVTMTVTTHALVTFHTQRVCTIRHVMGPRLKSLTRDSFFGEMRSTTLPRKRSLLSHIVLPPCSRRYRQYKLRFKPPQHPTYDNCPRTPDSHPHRRTRRMWKGCIHVQAREGGGAQMGEYAYTRCTTALA
jgi:hypothetical protein